MVFYLLFYFRIKGEGGCRTSEVGSWELEVGRAELEVGRPGTEVCSCQCPKTEGIKGRSDGRGGD